MTTAGPQPGQPVVFRNATVLTMDDAHTVLTDADVLIDGERIAAVGPNLEVPEGTAEIDATGGIVMPGMIDTHRHMWQTAMRGYGADWTLTQYFVYYYLTWGKKFRPQDYYAGNLLSAIEAIDAGVTTSVDWSHGLQTTEYADAAVDALEAVPGRFVLAYGNIHQGAWEWATTPEFRDFYNRRIDGKGDMLGFQIAFDLPGVEGFPEKAAFDVARDLGVAVTTHAGVFNVTSDVGINQMYDGGYMVPGTIYVHAATLSAGLLPQDRRHRRVRLDLHRERVQRRPGLLAHLEAAQVRHPCLAVAWTPASGGAVTSSARCGPRSTRTARWSTSRRTPAALASPTTSCGPRTSLTTRPAAGRRRSASTRWWAASRRARKPTWC